MQLLVQRASVRDERLSSTAQINHDFILMKEITINL